MLRLTQINIYPVKSLDGFSPQSAIVEERGLQYDRRWMIVDENGVFMTQRNYRKMTQLRATIIGNQLMIQQKNDASNNILIPINEENDVIDVEVWQDRVEACKTTAAADDFLSDFLSKKCHLVKMPDFSKRNVEQDYNTGNDIVSFADGFPFLIIGESSINDLNNRLDNPLNEFKFPLEGMRRFRTNFVFSGGEPYEEDFWTNFNIGNVPFLGCKPCGRCMMITLNPDTGERSNEPLDTLASYRSVGKKIKFGQNVIWEKSKWTSSFPPEIMVNDIISLSLDLIIPKKPML
jgi:hypothetical protein